MPQRKQLNVFRLRLLPLFLVAMFALSVFILPVYASTYVGYVSAQQGSSTCGANCATQNSLSLAIGTIEIAPFTGQLISVSYFTGSAVPTQVAITTFSGTTKPSTGTFSCSGGGTCQFASNGQASTLQAITALTGLSPSTFTTTTLPTPVNVNNGQWIGIVFFESPAQSTNGILMFCGSGATPSCATTGGTSGTNMDAEIDFGSSNPAVGSNFNTAGSGGGCSTCIVGGSFQTTSSSGSIVTQCYGNCGTPPITVVNSNSTKLINFNTSITLFYQFQSNINGIINNVTLNYANTCGSGNKCTVNTLFLGAYSAGQCSSNVQPFTSACPGSRLSQATFSPPGKGKLSMQCPSSCTVVNGQWLAVAVSASFSGIEINDTNTNVNLFQVGGITPTTISQSSSASNLCGGCKMGLWAWITGNVVTGPGSVGIPPTCGNGIGDYLTCLTLTFCTGTPNAGCQLAGGLFWSMIYSVVGIVGLMWVDHKFLGSSEGIHVPATGYVFVPLGIQFMFISLGILPLWWGILLIMAISIMFTSILLGVIKSRQA